MLGKQNQLPWVPLSASKSVCTLTTPLPALPSHQLATGRDWGKQGSLFLNHDKLQQIVVS